MSELCACGCGQMTAFLYWDAHACKACGVSHQHHGELCDTCAAKETPLLCAYCRRESPPSVRNGWHHCGACGRSLPTNEAGATATTARPMEDPPEVASTRVYAMARPVARRIA